jgi:hypothetical protein
MAEPAEYGLTKTDLRILKEVVARVRGGQFDLGGPADVPRNRTWVMRAMTTGIHFAGATQTVNLCDESWGEITGETIEAENPATAVDIPNDRQLLLVPGSGAALILWADVCDGA